MKATIRSKLFATPIIALVLSRGVIAFALVQMNTLANLTEKIYNHPLQVTRAVLQTNVGILRMHRSMKDVALSKNDLQLNEAIEIVDQRESEVYGHLAIVQEWILGDEGRQLQAETHQLFKDWRPIRDEVIALVKAGKREEAAEITKGKGADHVELLESKMEELKEYAANKAGGMLSDAKETRQRTLTNTTALLLLTLVIIATVGGGIARNLSRPIQHLTSVADRVRRGDLTLRAEGITDKEIGNLAETFNGMVERLALWNQALEDEVVQRTKEIQESAETINKLNESLEEKVQERTRELEYANKELETFSYSVSHDLKAPLRALEGFSKQLHLRYSGQLDETGNRWLEFIQSNAARMDSLINDILSFSRLGRADLKKVSVDMNKVVQEVLSRQEELYDKEIKLNCSELPKAMGDPHMIELLWGNLIDNAIKYSSANDEIIVEISGNEEKGNVHYKIVDHGVGFDMRYYDKLFGIFQRLHSPEEFPGSGVGLANVNRIISKHGGKIWATSEVGKGAIFEFTLPIT